MLNVEIEERENKLMGNFPSFDAFAFLINANKDKVVIWFKLSNYFFCKNNLKEGKLKDGLKKNKQRPRFSTKI